MMKPFQRHYERACKLAACCKERTLAEGADAVAEALLQELLKESPTYICAACLESPRKRACLDVSICEAS